MTAAEYRTLREACGLTQKEAMALHGVSYRTILHWEQGRNRVPAAAAETIWTLSRSIDTEVMALLARQVPGRKRNSPVVLVRCRTEDAYRRAARKSLSLPMGAHGAVIQRALVELSRSGVAVDVVWAEDEEATH